MKKKFKIGNITIGDYYPPQIIAEIGINHNGSLDLAIEICDSAIRAGAKIIKHQTHIAEEEMSFEAKKIIPGNSNLNIFDIIKNSQLKESDEIKLCRYIRQKKAIFISTPFSKKAADRLAKLNVPAFKIGSGECNNYPLVEYICKKKKPIILSTGMNDLKSISKSVKIIRKYKLPYVLMHCTNLYPTPKKLVRLNCIDEIRKKFKDAIVGLSDHTIDNFSCYGAAALGAKLFEKHFVDSKLKRSGPDISSSMDERELQDMIKGINSIHNSLGGGKHPLKEESKTIAFAYASVAIEEDIKKGQKLTKKNIFTKRPSGGDFSVADYKKLLGKKVNKDVKKGYQLKKKDIYG